MRHVLLHIRASFVFRLLVCLCFCFTKTYAQTDPIYIDGPTYISKDENLQWYGDVELGPNAEVYIQDDAVILFYGANFKIDPGAQILGANSAWTVFTPGQGTGRIQFVQPNPNDGSSIQQTLDGGYGGTPSLNTLTSIEINNPHGVALVNSSTRVGTDVLFTQGHLFLAANDAILRPAATLTGYGSDRYVVTDASGHLVKEDYSTSFVFPVGMAVNDYTPAGVTPGSTNTVHVNVTNYAASPSVEDGTDGMDRTWNIYGNNAGPANVSLQHNSTTNQASWLNTSNFVTQYGTAPNNTGDASTASPWQSNAPGTSGTAGGAGTETQIRNNVTLAVSATANEAWLTKASNTSTPLPVVLTSFEVSRAGEGAALVRWKVAMQTNSKSFVVERSHNARNFDAINVQEAAGDTSNEIVYEYADREPLAGMNYYRLKMIDIDGSFAYSVIRNVDFGNAGKVPEVYPNPAVSYLRLANVDLRSVKEVSLINSAGKVVWAGAPGSGAISADGIDISGIQPGVYVVKVTGNTGVPFSKKIIVQK